jgi:hypothetical protein
VSAPEKVMAALFVILIAYALLQLLVDTLDKRAMTPAPERESLGLRRHANQAIQLTGGQR